MRSNVSELLNKINRLAGLTGFSKLEKDLLKQYLRELYEAIDSVDVKEEEPVLEQPVVEVKKEEAIQPEVLIATVSPVVEPEKEVKPRVKEEVKPVTDSVLSSVKVSINEVVKPGASLNERVKGAGKEIYEHISTKPMKDMIDLNRRFVFVKDLFGGDSDAMAKAVAHIDSLEDYDAAFDYCSQVISVSNKWDEKAQPVKLFYKLVKQKFGEE